LSASPLGICQKKERRKNQPIRLSVGPGEKNPEKDHPKAERKESELKNREDKRNKAFDPPNSAPATGEKN
jgi:hypothetical protein